jgi:hypothetical protein
MNQRNSRYCLAALTLIVIASLFPWVATAGDQIDLRSVSEEDPPAVCPRGYVVKGIRCSGGYCDNKTLRCQRYRAVSPRYEWSDWFSEEAPAQQTNSGGFVSGLACSGAYCDNLRLQFVFDESGLRNSGFCRFTPSFSEEQGYRECPAGHYLSGVKCDGSYCDNIALYCCRPR